MPDISMCGNKSCPSRMKCYRYRAVPHSWQSWMAFEVEEGKDRCDSFAEIHPGRSALVPESELS